MNAGVIAALLIAFIAATPCAGGSEPSPLITKVENAQHTPATSPAASTPIVISTK
ncbi:hypothetical protein SY2F82_00080 [Streptomyces sp. Y2F8-2]|nr:hypothetical protein SY2F82_00080 [Streptomyces sp. Y2F8-2]